MTVCQIQRNNAEERIRALIEGKPMPQLALPKNGDEAVEDEPNVPLDLDQYASDQIRSYIGKKFRGHELTRLATEVPSAQGYKVLMSPVGPDGGIDIIAVRCFSSFIELFLLLLTALEYYITCGIAAYASAVRRRLGRL
jgi:restriction system protein